MLRALEVGADEVWKATDVDGVYDKNPLEHKDAKRYDEVSFDEVIDKGLEIMDQTAFALAKGKGLPIRVFNFFKEAEVEKMISGKPAGTLVS